MTSFLFSDIIVSWKQKGGYDYDGTCKRICGGFRVRCFRCRSYSSVKWGVRMKMFTFRVFLDGRYFIAGQEATSFSHALRLMEEKYKGGYFFLL